MQYATHAIFFSAGSTECTLRTLWRNHACAPDWRYMADVTTLYRCLRCICTAVTVWHELITFVLSASLSVHAHVSVSLYTIQMCMTQWCYCHAGNSAQLTCNNPHCRVTLQYPRGASQVQCSLCNTINTAIDVSKDLLSSRLQDAFTAEPYLQSAATYFTCLYWSSCLAASTISCVHTSIHWHAHAQKHESSPTS
jgi:LSD1 subclass zinc finger protein